MGGKKGASVPVPQLQIDEGRPKSSRQAAKNARGKSSDLSRAPYGSAGREKKGIHIQDRSCLKHPIGPIKRGSPL